ncbi:MAG TPA: thermonuclease family protein [Acidobacteriota bacterium]|nr:thermonuclease family protein [Acidobacteriota bacterium]HQQ45864.1 thermonuclease family protein [Acidobacteriota bacterium]
MPLALLSPSSLLSISDGDTPEVKMGVRMLGIDTPELHFPGTGSPDRQDPALARLPGTAAFQKLPKALREYLEPRLEEAGTRQKKWALLAKEALVRIVEEGLRVEGKKQRRKLFLACGKEVIDCYGRILAYAGPYLTKEERAKLGQPDTFNLRMLKEGFAVSNIHGTNLPKEEDIRLVIEAVKSAKNKKLGFWKEGDKILHGYEFRALVRMAMGEKGFRYKVGSLEDHLKGEKIRLLKPEEYIDIEEENRVFF